MNFRHMPELGWVAGYPMALTLMLLSSAVLYLGLQAAALDLIRVPSATS